MRHRKIGRKFGRESHQRVALLRSLCSSLVTYGKIKTTLQKAKDLRSVIEKALTIAKGENLLKKEKLEKFFHSGHDKELQARNEVKKYVSSFDKDTKKKVVDYFKDPKKVEKPAFILQYLPPNRGKKTQQSPKILRVKGIISKFVDEIAPRFKGIAGGYTRIFRLGSRRGDAAEMALIEFSR